MISTRNLVIALSLAVLIIPWICAQDLASYRDFQFGMNLIAVARQAGMNPSEAKILHRRPAMIQELWWERSSSASSPRADPVRNVVFCFYDDQLFRMVVTYDRHGTEGLTDEDMIETISTQYGIAARPAATIILFSTSQIYNESEKVIACWEDSQTSYNLFRSSNQSGLGMLVFSKRLDALAQAAIIKAIRLDAQEAPQREEEP